MLLKVRTQSTPCLSYLYVQSVMCPVFGDVTEVNRYSFMSLWKRSYKSCKGNKLRNLQQYRLHSMHFLLHSTTTQSKECPPSWLFRALKKVFIYFYLWSFMTLNSTADKWHPRNVWHNRGRSSVLFRKLWGENMLRSKMIWIIHKENTNRIYPNAPRRLQCNGNPGLSFLFTTRMATSTSKLYLEQKVWIN